MVLVVVVLVVLVDAVAPRAPHLPLLTNIFAASWYLPRYAAEPTPQRRAEEEWSR